MNKTIVRYGVRALTIGVAGAVMATNAYAQRYAGAGGLGSALGGMLGVGLPDSVATAVKKNVPNALKTVIAQLNGAQMTSVPAGAQMQVGAVIDGSAPANVTSLVNSLMGGGVSRETAYPLVSALTMLGTSRGRFGELVDAVKAYDAAVNSLPASASAPPVLLVTRAALSQLIEATK